MLVRSLLLDGLRNMADLTNSTSQWEILINCRMSTVQLHTSHSVRVAQEGGGAGGQGEGRSIGGFTVPQVALRDC